MKLTLIASVTAAIASCVWAGSVLAAPGSLDTSFGTAGVTITDDSGSNGEGGMALDSQDRILVAGQMNNKMMLARYTSNGVLDSTFDGDGIATVTVNGTPNAAQAVAVQSDGKIVIAGLSYDGTSDNFGVARLNEDGTLDSSFDGDGVREIDFGSGDQANAVAIQPDGKIVLAGYAITTVHAFAAARLNRDGSLDTTFDGDGKVVNSVESGIDSDANAVAIQSDGRVLLAGLVGSNKVGLVRYNSDGSLDTTYDGDGIVANSLGSINISGANDLVLNSDSQAVIVGSSGSGVDKSVALARFTTAGALDMTFGVNGVTETNVTAGTDFGSGLSRDPDGRLVVAAFVNEAAFLTGEMAILRYDANGAIDNTFGTSGIFRKDVFTTFDAAFRVGRQKSNGKYVGMGFGIDSGNKLLLTRVDGDVADISVTSAFDHSSYTLGDTATLTLKVGNAGPQSAAGVTLSETLPTGATFVLATPAQGSCVNGTTLQCSLGSIAAGASATVTVALKAATAGTSSDSTRISELTFDGNSQNDTATAALVVNAPPVVDNSDKRKPKLIARILTKKLKVVARSRRIGVRLGTDEAVKGILRLKIAGSGKTLIKKSVVLTKKGAKSFVLKVSRKNYIRFKRKAKTGGKRRPYAKIQITFEAQDSAGNKSSKKANGKLHR